MVCSASILNNENTVIQLESQRNLPELFEALKSFSIRP